MVLVAAGVVVAVLPVLLTGAVENGIVSDCVVVVPLVPPMAGVVATVLPAVVVTVLPGVVETIVVGD